ncbi:MAG: hypothetical protein IPN95_07690 [Bacteroidetes bacterium]|nr:hypothetical protein [Bacteroidota bacterium]MBL0018664.1 hypothetical protein [Bacteroidota bacterium]MBP6639430.1 hypothetical protein [Bacteroidia bacterium]MBP6721060.1 hypothetical protein [Bacteroidia bacterium]
MISSQSTENPALEAIRNDIRIIGPMMRSFSTHVINEEISEFPVYIAYQDPVSVGKPFLSKEKDHLNWNYNVSILEDFVKRGVVKEDKLEDFLETFGDPEERACIFVILPTEGGFVFIPYEIEDEEDHQLYFPSEN